MDVGSSEYMDTPYYLEGGIVMAWTAAQKKRAAKALLNKMYGAGKECPIHWLDGEAALGAIDAAFDAKPDLSVSGLNLTLKQYLVSQIPEPFKTESTAEEKALLLSYWALEETGVIGDI